MAKLRTLVVGATGYLGAYILACETTDFRLMGTSTVARQGMLRLDLQDHAEFDYAAIQECDVILFAAAVASPNSCADQNARAWRVNVSGTSFFIRRAIDRGARVVFFSSDTVYGDCAEICDESTPCNPVGYYAEMKREVEGRFEGDSSFKSIRLSYVFSRGDKLTQYLYSCYIGAEVAKLYHPFLRAVVHRDDVVAGALALAKHWEETPEQIINFGGPEVLSRVEFAKYLRDARLHNLCWQVSEPDADYFKNRPRVINMSSPLFERILGRKPHSLREAARIEFPPSSHVEQHG